MTETRIKFSNIVQNQLPSYVREEYPLVSEFLSQYYISQEFQGAPIDLIQNIDKYIKIDEQTNQVDSAVLLSDVSIVDDTVYVSFENPSNGTYGFPDSYGLIKIDDEIITYTGKTDGSFTGCIRGFSGIDSYIKQNNPDELLFSSSEVADHFAGATITNLSSLFLKEFLIKSKHQLLPGFDNRSLHTNLNQSIFIKQSQDFYRSKGTDESFRILFNVLYGEDASIIRPKENLFRPSDAKYTITKDLVVESISGDPENLTNSTLLQDTYINIPKAYAPITKVEKLISDTGKTYYKLSLDGGYNRDINVDGSVYGNFSVHPKTKLIGQVSIGTTVLCVDSTVGFPPSGELLVYYTDNTTGVVSYSSKSLNQFFECQNLSGTVADGSNVGINTYAYSQVVVGTTTETIKVRINSVLSNLDIVDDTYYYSAGDTAVIKTLGVNEKNSPSNNWLFNIATSYDVIAISLINSLDNTYDIVTGTDHTFKIGDSLSIIDENNTEKTSTIIDITSSKSLSIRGQGKLSPTSYYTIKRNLSKVNSLNFPSTSVVNADVQNIYKIKDRILVASPSLPYYNEQSLEVTDRSLIFSGTYSNDTFNITSSKDHGFYTGDLIYYTPEKVIVSSTDSDGNIKDNEVTRSYLFDEGIYYIKRVSSTIVKFAKSESDILNSNFVSVSSTTTVTNNKLELYNLKSKTLKSQKLLREISSSESDGELYPTNPGLTGMLINGVEILNYKSKDIVYSGPLEDIQVISSGSGYDVINPPVLNITDSVGSGSTGYCAVNGSLSEIRIINPGFDYEETPIINITGGNGVNAVALANMKMITHQASFNSQGNAALIGLGSTLSTIGFTTYHKFRNVEKVIYRTNGEKSVGGLSTDSSYYVSVQSPYIIKLHNTLNDSVSGINTVTLTSYGTGNHTIESFDKKSILGSINIVNSGSNYENKKRTAQHTGVSTSLNSIELKSHDFKSGEIVKYTTEGTSIGGLSTNTNYYITKIDSDSFKLSQVGSGDITKEFYYQTNQYVEFSSVGFGTHIFNYPDISVEVIGRIGISSTNGETFQAVVQPIFRGNITSVHLSSGGTGYGAEILNYNRLPLISLDSGSGGQLTPVISNGKIVEVLINNPGKNYNSPPNLSVTGGVGAVLTPVLQNGQIVSVKVSDEGAGYTSSGSSIRITPAGSSSILLPKITSWTVNLFQKYLNNITGDDGFLTEGINSEYELQYAHLYAPRKLREVIYSVDSSGKILYGNGKTDLKKVNNIEIPSSDHSPIIGWAYDGNPIYGPYGYVTKQGGTVTQMKSGYVEYLKSNRPSVSEFPFGFFIEDYVHFNVSDETVLDENNGRFCVTPEFPNGTYAYFATVSNSSADSSGVFAKYKKPIFPYLIGENYKSKPNEFNFKKLSNQDNINLNDSTWVRNTQPYNLIDDNASYDYLTIPNLLNQTVDIKNCLPGFIENVGIVTGGNNYKINDSIVFDNSGTSGYNASAKVSRIGGKQVNSVSVATSTIYNVELYPSNSNGSILIYSQNPHNFTNDDIITVSGLNTTSSLIEGSYQVGISTLNTLVLTAGVGTTGATGLVTYFSVRGNLNEKNIRENDIFSIGTEKIKILNIDSLSSRIRVLRSTDSTTGSAHTATELLYENSRKLTINTRFKTAYDSIVNKQIYFNPIESVGLGTISGVGIGTTLSFSNPGAGITQIFIPTKTIYIPKHNLETGDQLTYSSNGGSVIGVSTNGISTSVTLSNQSTLYVAKISDDLIGISTVKVGVGSTGTFVGITSTTNGLGTLYFTGIGSGTNHSFQTNYSTISGQISRNIVTVSVAETHGLQNNDTVYIDVNPSISTTFTIKYNDYNRKLLVNPKDFSAVGINTVDDSISIANHNFSKGQKVVHTSSSPSGGLQNNEIYYVVIVDNNTIKLSDSYHSAISLNPEIVGITSSSNGTLSAVNPPIVGYRDSQVSFDLSDSSLSYIKQENLYPAFNLNLYKDSNFTQELNSTEKTDQFEVMRYGTVGVTTDAKVVLSINNHIPEKLYYTLTPIYDNSLPPIKEEINIDSSVFANNEIQIKVSGYNGQHNVTVASTSEFTYNVAETPESVSYASSTSVSILKYYTDSTYAYGPVSKINILNKGQNYYSLPAISTINSDTGSGALLEAHITSIGKINKTQIKDIGFDFPCDHTIRPSVSLPQIAKVEPLASFDSIGISSFGRGYSSAPKLIVLDGKTNQVVPEVDLRYNLGDNKVTILKNAYGLNDVPPTIIPTQNSNGVGISSASFNSTTNDVTITLSVGFSTADSFPFEINDKVLIENISSGIGSTSRGYNSKDYEYQLFTINYVDSNLGGNNATIRYSLNGFLNSGEIPGTYDSTNSSGRIIPQKYFPIFNPVLRKNNFIIGEKVNSTSSSGYVGNWNSKTNQLKIISNKDFVVGEVIEGSVSKTQGVTSSIDKFDSFFDMDSKSTVILGWQTQAGFLNTNSQKLQDGEYYQNFSYSVKSRIDYDTWKDAVSTLNHTLGFRKYADYQLESSASNSMVVGFSTYLTSVEVINDIVEVVDLNCVYDFDLVKENSMRIGSSIFSDEVTFSSRILTDYFESVGNRVLSIDDISPKFNSNPRETRFSEVHRFNLTDGRAQKYITYIRDRRYTSQRQTMLLTLIHDDSIGYIDQYGRVESTYDLGSFDFAVEGTEGVILFYPTKYSVNDYDISTLSYNLRDSLSGVGTSSFGSIVDLKTSSVAVSSGSTTIVGIASTYTSAKVLVEITGSNGDYQFDELNILHNGTTIEFIDYGQLTTISQDIYSSSGLGTYYPYFSGSQLKIDFTPNVGVAATINTIQVAIANTLSSGIGTFDMKHARLQATSTSIASSTSPVATVIAEYPEEYDCAYAVLQVSDITNNRHQLSELVILDDGSETYIAEYANIDTFGGSGLGTVGSATTTSSTRLTFTPLANINVEVKIFFNAIRYQDDDKDIVNFNNASLETNDGVYYGTERDVKKSFDLTHDGYEIFQRSFDGSNSSIVNISTNTISLPNHFFVTGEELVYTNAGSGSTTAIGIGTTTFVSVGSTDKLPASVYVIKLNNNDIKLARSAEDALKSVPATLDFTSVGIGTTHSFTSKNQNAKVIVAIDNLIQSPVVASSVTTILSTNAYSTDDVIYFSGISSFFGGDLIKVGSEIMRINSVGVGSTNAIGVSRPWLGTSIAGYSTGTLVTKVSGNYNIVDNTLNFTDAPYGNIPIVTSNPNEKDWSGVSTSSSFQGRSFLRSGTPNTTNETYYKNYIFDDISSNFNGNKKDFTLKSNNSNLTGISNENAVILINDIFQAPGLSAGYTLSENVGITSISFVGTGISVSYDVNISNLPIGGIIVSVGSSEGFGYQPLVSAGGTAIVSAAGTISSISIGNSGSGYRVGVQTVRVGVGTSTTGVPNIQFIGTASVSNGHIVSIAITNPGVGYTTSNPPYVFIDDPLSYSDIPLIYSSSSSEIGTQATIDIVVGQGSSVIDFELKNTGYGYISGEILTIPITSIAGIPTTSSAGFREFQISIQNTFTDNFAGWSLGELQSLDSLDSLFDGERIVFPISYLGNLISIRSSRGSNINVQDSILVFINDILQEPGKGYIFPGGSSITFTEPPKVGDTSKIIFYKGSGSIDVIERNILETVKIGDELTLGYDSSIGQSSTLQEDSRTVTSINSTDLLNTNPYFGPGNTSDESLVRTVVWCRQSEDKIINEKEIGKDRILYESQIYPSSYLIQSVGIGSTIAYVDSIRPFFNSINESNLSLSFQKNVRLLSQNSKVAAAATATVSIAGTISSIVISDGGVGYTTNPSVTIENPVGLGTTQRASASASITSGIVTSIIITSPGIGYSYVDPPLVLIEFPSFTFEDNTASSYEGDFGIITGIATTSVGVASTGIVFDFVIPNNSFLRNSSITSIVTVSGIQTGYYFTVYNSNVGGGVTSLDSSGSTVGIGTTFLDNVYQVAAVSIAQTSAVGFGITYVAKVTVNVSSYNGLTGIGYSNFYGEFSWGKVSLGSRVKQNSYDAYTLNGFTGISTGTILKRTNSLKYLNYL